MEKRECGVEQNTGRLPRPPPCSLKDVYPVFSWKHYPVLPGISNRRFQNKVYEQDNAYNDINQQIDSLMTTVNGNVNNSPGCNRFVMDCQSLYERPHMQGSAQIVDDSSGTCNVVEQPIVHTDDQSRILHTREQVYRRPTSCLYSVLSLFMYRYRLAYFMGHLKCIDFSLLIILTLQRTFHV